MRWIARMLVGVVVLVVLLAAMIRLTTFHPPAVAGEQVVCPDAAPTLEPGQSLEVMNWNVQYFAGTEYVFWDDLLDESGPDERPSPESITATFAEVARVIAEEDPDVIVLQEVDDGAARTDGEDQLARLLAQVDDAYTCHASAFYWQAAFVPHPRIMGSVGMKLSTISKYRIDEATRYQQVAETRALLDDLTDAGEPWVIGGDFNLLPPGRQNDDLGPAQQAYYEPDSELEVLTDAYPSVPSLEEANGPDREAWFTHAPNDPAVDGPDRTIDCLFHAPTLTLGDHAVRRDGTLDVSDHLPVMATYVLPGAG